MNEEEIEKITANITCLKPASLQDVIRTEMENISNHFRILAVALRIINQYVECPICIDTGTVQTTIITARLCTCAKGKGVYNLMMDDIEATAQENK